MSRLHLWDGLWLVVVVVVVVVVLVVLYDSLYPHLCLLLNMDQYFMSDLLGSYILKDEFMECLEVTLSIH